MPNDQAKQLFKGTLILTAAAILTKILSAFYRVPFQNIVGDIGFYIYQQVYPFYGIAVILSTYGFPLVISKLYTEEKEKGDKGNVKQLLFISFLFLFAFGVLLFTGLYLGADWLAVHMNDPKLASLLRIIAYVFLIMPFISFFRGYFQGTGNMIPTAVSQVSEQFIRVTTILISAFILVKQSASLYKVGSGAVFGSITGGIIATLILLFYWLRLKPKKLIRGFIHYGKSKAILKTLLIQGLTVCISSMLLVLIQLADSLTLYSLLTEAGVSTDKAKELKGVYDRGQPLIQLGTVVATSMSLSLVPLITREKIKQNTFVLKEKIQLAIKISILIGVGATFGLATIMKPANMMLFKNADGSDVLTVLCTVIALASVIMTLTSILQGLGVMTFPAVVILGSFAVKYLLNIVLVPISGTMGAALSSFFTLILVLGTLLIKLQTLIGKSLIDKKFFIVVGSAALIMVTALKLFLMITNYIYIFRFSDRLFASIQAMAAVLIGVLIYLIIIIRGELLKENELSLLPFGSKLTMFLPKRNRR